VTEKIDVDLLILFLAIISAGLWLMGTQMVKIILPFLAERIGARGILLARVLYIGLLFFTFLPPIVGFLCDKYGYKKLILITSILDSAAVLLYLIARNYNELLIIRIIHGFFGVSLSASFLSFIGNTVKKRGGVYIGAYRASTALGMAVAPLIIIMLVGFGYQVIVISASILILMPLVVVLCKEEEPIVKKAKMKDIIRSIVILENSPLMLSAIIEILCFVVFLAFFSCYFN